MNRFRKILSAALAGCMAVSVLMMSAGAANTGTEAAREKAIYGSQAWTVNGAAAIQHSDGTVEPVPEFSALYPGWTVPKQAASVSSTALAEVADVGSHSISGAVKTPRSPQPAAVLPPAAAVAAAPVSPPMRSPFRTARTAL